MNKITAPSGDKEKDTDKKRSLLAKNSISYKSYRLDCLIDSKKFFVYIAHQLYLK